VPRGRRLGSFRFLETLEAGCVPVVLSNGWVLPFSEIVDWSQAAVVADERSLFLLPEMLRSLSPSNVYVMKRRGKILWERNFNSVETIVERTLEVTNSFTNNITLAGVKKVILPKACREKSQRSFSKPVVTCL